MPCFTAPLWGFLNPYRLLTQAYGLGFRTVGPAGLQKWAWPRAEFGYRFAV